MSVLKPFLHFPRIRNGGVLHLDPKFDDEFPEKRSILKGFVSPRADPIKLCFFVSWFLLSSMHVCYIHLEQKSLMVKWPNLRMKNGKILCYLKKKFYKIGYWSKYYQILCYIWKNGLLIKWPILTERKKGGGGIWYLVFGGIWEKCGHIGFQ